MMGPQRVRVGERGGVVMLNEVKHLVRQRGEPSAAPDDLFTHPRLSLLEACARLVDIGKTR